MNFWTERFNSNVLFHLFNSDRGLRAGRFVVRGESEVERGSLFGGLVGVVLFSRFFLFRDLF